MKMSSVTIAEQDLMQPKCAGHYLSTPQVTSYAFTVEALTTLLVIVGINQTITERNQGPHRETLVNQVPGWTTIG